MLLVKDEAAVLDHHGQHDAGQTDQVGNGGGGVAGLRMVVDHGLPIHWSTVKPGSESEGESEDFNVVEWCDVVTRCPRATARPG